MEGPLTNKLSIIQENLTSLPALMKNVKKIHNEAGPRSVTVDARARNVGNFIKEDMPIDKHKCKQITVQRREHAKMDSELDCLVKTQKRSRKSEKASQSSSCCLNNAPSLIQQLPSTSAEISLNRLTLAAILEAVCAQDNSEEGKLSQCFQRSRHHGKYDQDEINIQQVQMSAKVFFDQIYMDKKFKTSSESNSFDSLEVLNSRKDLFMELLPDPNSLLVRRIKNLHRSQSKKETVKSFLDARFSECEGADPSNSAEPASVLTMQNGKMNKNSVQKSNHQCQYSRKTNFKAQPSVKKVILKPAPRDAKYSNANCSCSLLQPHDKLGRKASDAKTTSFSFREMKKKLKHTFGVTRNEPGQFLVVVTTDKLSQDRSTLSLGGECICRGVDIKNSFNSSTNAEKIGKPWKKLDLKSNRNSDIACLTDVADKKLDFLNVRFSNKQEFDVILEAKRQLSARLNNINSVEAMTSKKSPKTLGQILLSPEHDLWPLSPRKDSQYSSGSAKMRFSPYNTSSRIIESGSKVPNGRERASLTPSRSNTEVTSCGDCGKCDSTLQTVNAKTRSPTLSIEEEEHDTDISETDNMKSNGEPKIVEISSTLGAELHVLDEVPSDRENTDITRTMQITDPIKSQNDDEIVMRSILDSPSENEATTSTADDFPSTPLSIHQLDTANSIKYQEQHRSPVSVLEPLFVEDADSPPNIVLQTDGKQLQPFHLDFEECSSDSLAHDPSTSANSSVVQVDHLSHYLQMVLQACCLSWDQLSEVRSPSEDLLHAYFYDEVELPPTDCYYDPKLLFDHIHEILLEIYKCHFCLPPWLAFVKPKTSSVPLAELVIDEIMKEADFYLLPTTEKRTLDQLVSKDVAKYRSWLDVRLDTEQIVIEISEDFLEESILDIVLEFYT